MEMDIRGRKVALAGAMLHVVFTVAMVVVWRTTGTLAALNIAWLLGLTAAPWLLAAHLFYCRQLAKQEQIEGDELARDGRSIFQGDDEVQPAAARLAFMDRWVVPIFSLLWVAALAGLASPMTMWLPWWVHPVSEAPTVDSTAVGIVLSLLPAFVAFLFSFYTVGMAKHPSWRLLHAPGTLMLLGFILMAGEAGALLATGQGYPQGEWVVALVVPVVMGLLALETLVAQVLDFFRPRMPGQAHRLAFDSRLLGLLAEPGRIGHSVADTLNYQFGFEVSSTWFYKLLSKALIPMVAFALVVMLLSTTVMVVQEGEQAVVSTWGRIDPDREPVGAGLHLKWPWPINGAQYHDIGAVHEVRLGVGAERTAEEMQKLIVAEGTFRGRELYLWGEEHGRRKEEDFLVAVPPEMRSRQDVAEAPPLSIIKLSVLVKYRIANVYKYAYEFVDARKLLECVANREMVRYCASATLDSKVVGDADRPEAIMTSGRADAARELHARIQRAVDELDLGVEIASVGILAAHPPPEAAAEFEAVIQEERKREEMIHAAQAWAGKELATAAGDPDFALELAQAIRRLRELEDLNQLRPTPAEFERALEGYIGKARKEIETLSREIDAEKLLAHLARVRAKERLRVLLADEHLAETLLAIREDPDGYDFSEAISEAQAKVEALFRTASGEASARVARARGDRWQAEMTRRGEGNAFQRELLAYEASPRVFRLYRYLQMLEDVLPGIPKLILAVPRERVEIRVDHREGASGLGSEVTFEPSDAETR
jgi:regulator of protease activity HflC (stomatin/prohibitin superfamily)